MIPVRKVMEEICPSPVARKLRIKRRAPEGRSDWSGCGTMEGLNSAADSKSIRKRNKNQSTAVSVRKFYYRSIGSREPVRTVLERICGFAGVAGRIQRILRPGVAPLGLLGAT